MNSSATLLAFSKSTGSEDGIKKYVLISLVYPFNGALNPSQNNLY
jgi:hypothetical protein